jgi:uncharacterized protein (TIGR03067 family)
MRPLALLIVALLAGVTPAAPVPKDLKRGEGERVVGTWKPAEGKTEWFRFDADGTLTAWDATRPNTPSSYTYALDLTATPRRMTWTVKGEKEPYFRCVYELDGDTLRLRYVSAGADWPAKADAACGPYFCEQTRDRTAK